MIRGAAGILPAAVPRGSLRTARRLTATIAGTVTQPRPPFLAVARCSRVAAYFPALLSSAFAYMRPAVSTFLAYDLAVDISILMSSKANWSAIG